MVTRRLLLTGAEHQSAKQWRRFTHMLDTADLTGIGAAWVATTAWTSARRARAELDRKGFADEELRLRRPAPRSDSASLVPTTGGWRSRPATSRPKRRPKASTGSSNKSNAPAAATGT